MEHHHPGRRDGVSDRGFANKFQSASAMLSSHSDLLQTASSLFSSQPQPQHGAPFTDAPPNVSHSVGDGGKKPSHGEVFASAQVVFQAAKTKFHGADVEGAEFDKAKVAGALGNLMGAAAHYGKVDDMKYGKYVHKAEEYLRSYEQKHGRSSGVGGTTYVSSAHQNSPSQGGTRT